MLKEDLRMKRLAFQISFGLFLVFFFFASLVFAEEKKGNDTLWYELNKKIQEHNKFCAMCIDLERSYYSHTDSKEWLPLWKEIIPSGDLSQSVVNWLKFVNFPMENLKDDDGSIVKGLKESFLKECEKDGHFKFQEFWGKIEAVPSDKTYLPLCGFQILCYAERDPDHNLERMGLYEKVMALSLIFDKKDEFEKAKNDFFELYKKAATTRYEHFPASSLSEGGYYAVIDNYEACVLKKYEKYMTEDEVKKWQDYDEGILKAKKAYSKSVIDMLRAIEQKRDADKN